MRDNRLQYNNLNQRRNKMARTYGPEEQAKLKKIVDEGVNVLSEIEDLKHRFERHYQSSGRRIRN